MDNKPSSDDSKNADNVAERVSLMDGSAENVTTTQPKPLGVDGEEVVSEGVGDDSVRVPDVPPSMQDCNCCCKCCVICLTLTCRNVGLCITNCKDCTLSIGSIFNFSIEGREEAVTSFSANSAAPPDEAGSDKEVPPTVDEKTENQN